MDIRHLNFGMWIVDRISEIEPSRHVSILGSRIADRKSNHARVSRGRCYPPFPGRGAISILDLECGVRIEEKTNHARVTAAAATTRSFSKVELYPVAAARTLGSGI
jgi:hypothetical protein